MQAKHLHKIRILVCGPLPPPNFGHSVMYEMLMGSSFTRDCEIIFFDMKFWSYAKHRRVGSNQYFKMAAYWVKYVFVLVTRCPQYVLFDMTFNPMTLGEDYLFCLTGKLLGRRIILHDMGQYLPESYASSGVFLRTLIKHALRMSQAMIVIGEKIRQEYTPFFDPQRILVVPGSVEDTADMSLPASHKEEGILEVLYFSLLSPAKGLWTALEAIPMVVLKHPKVHFTFGGPIESPQLLEEMQEFIRERGLEKHVSYVGYIGDVAPRTVHYRNADIFIFPSHRDSFGLVMLHAMAESVPVVASLEGTVPEIIENGVNGLLFEKGNTDQLAEKILQLAGDAPLRRQMGTANRKRYLDHYSPQGFGRKMADAFGQIERMDNGRK